MSKRTFTATRGERVPGPRRRAMQRTNMEPVATRMIPVKGVGRYAGRDYCQRCGHTHARCICKGAE